MPARPPLTMSSLGCSIWLTRSYHAESRVTKERNTDDHETKTRKAPAAGAMSTAQKAPDLGGQASVTGLL